MTFQTAWTPAMLEVLERRIRQGSNYAEIAAEIGVSKNAVVSRAQRAAHAPDRPRGNPSRLAASAPPAKRCQWIEGAVPECLDAHGGAPFCGRPVEPGSPYCGEHRTRAVASTGEAAWTPGC